VSIYPETNTIFIAPPSIAALKERLEKRGTETEKSLATRLANCSTEIEKGLF
jgi:guanylate kinase